jgi:hypothetical protein
VGRKSTIAANPAIRAAVDGAIARGASIDAIKAMLDGMGADISRSAIGRHSAKYHDLAERQRDIRAAADAFASEFGNADDNQTRLMIQMVTTMITENIIAKGDGAGSALDLRLLAAAAKDAIGAAKLDDDRKRIIRKEAMADAAKMAGETMRRGGASAEMIETVRKRLMEGE